MALLRHTARFVAIAWIVQATMGMSFAASASEVHRAPGQQPRLASELELDLARRPDPYLVLDLAQRSLSVRLKGRSAAEFQLDAVTVLRLADWSQTAEPLQVPTVLHVARRPISGRNLQLPGELRAPSASEAAESAAEDVSSAIAAATQDEIPPAPEAYIVETREGWRLEFGRTAEPPGPLARWWQATRTGWSRSDGHTEPDDRLLLALSPEAAAHLHHLFRPGTSILLVTSENWH